MREDCWYKKVCTKDTCDNCIRYTEMSFLMENSGIPKKRQMPVSLVPDDIDLDSFIHLADIKNDIEQFVRNGDNLYICSEHTGNGKTSWAIKLMLKYFDRVWAGNGLRVRGYFANVPTLLSMLKDFGNNNIEKVKTILSNTDLVVWDDIASTKLSDFDITHLLMFIDHRTLQGLSNIYTGNIANKEQLGRCVGDRLASRIWNYSEIVEFKGNDRR